MKAPITRDLLRRVPALIQAIAPDSVLDIFDTKLPGFSLRLRPSGVHSYRVTFARGRCYTLGRLEALPPERARRTAQKALAAAADGRDLVRDRRAARAAARAEREAKAQDQTLGQFITRVYRSWALANLKCGEETVERLERVFEAWLDTPMVALTPWHVERWKASRRNAGVKPETINRDLADLRVLLARAVHWKKVPAHPLRDVRPEKVDRRAKRVRYLSPDEEGRLRQALHDRDEARRQARVSFNAWRRERGHPELGPCGPYTDHVTPVVLLALNTGLRRGELLHLRWTDVDLVQAQLWVRGETSKTGDTRVVELNDEAVRVLTTWGPKNDGLLFPGPTGEPMGEIKTAWTALLRQAKITRFRFHDLRHTFASKLVQRGVPLQVVQELLGHASMVMTQRYAHLAPSQRRAAVERLLREA